MAAVKGLSLKGMALPVIVVDDGVYLLGIWKLIRS